ncbi:hypothetical protein A2715_03905 [Candidatus Woesebacteria bacterium RIFCSPHIGHO2_01_FULL_39_32]|uniref:Integral membrane protein n=1 Tax=Candidatus Woesebacteria bacterium RIFCSPLOWO2_01_FULL_39_25 TaxID=1802521 RepID=A0A1F8BIW1_9BACT|nr:MAG: hypothetical protein A2124_03080 [Candidatus Woesebacteria bacterium GWB1_37_5]OGM25058.1 MAG: hypothetical protein A2715_03905 [Candidatus Woesebacteria bacterium RIFCSPHIGHO2_01_FULL_39_32]OGM35533.1 MAG: hypothetical protein A3F01_05055 [Candidatus Woesebacteria bacterium RIFCSPHIGHO2_12_FULL_38_11]OGM63973.1 MAG: hypothetical protein A2893_00495 [Candidatus Woesebacteria bacterium RIFCSPLOWO2_01_FULL_39_25]
MKIAQNPWGPVNPPDFLQAFDGGGVGGIAVLLNIILRTLIVVAGIYAVINLVIAGLAFISASGDPKRISDATAKIWQSLLGLLVAAGAFLIAAIIGEILYGNPGALLNIQYFTPQ